MGQPSSSTRTSTLTARRSPKASSAVSKPTPGCARLLVFFRSSPPKSIDVRKNSYLPYPGYYGFRTGQETRRGIYAVGARDRREEKEKQRLPRLKNQISRITGRIRGRLEVCLLI